MKIHAGKWALGSIALAGITYGLVEFRGPNGYAGLMERREQVRRLERENQNLRDELDRLDKRVDRLSHDPVAQELEIRKRLGLVKPGETVYVLQDKPVRDKLVRDKPTQDTSVPRGGLPSNP